MPEPRWWTGHRGEWFVVGQVLLILFVFLGPRAWHGWPSWPFPGGALATGAGLALLVGGLCFLAGGGLGVGSKLTPLPYPAEGAVLVQSGAFRLVRHPMYCGGILAAFGWALFRQGWLTLAYAALLFVFADVKARREEAWLESRFPEHRTYRQRVRKLIPFVY